MSNSINTLFGYTLADTKARTEVGKKIDKPTVDGTEGQVLQVVKNTDSEALETKWVNSGDVVGGLKNLTTTNKDSVIAAINELDSDKVDQPAASNTEGQLLMTYNDNGTIKAKYADLTFATSTEVEALFD